MLENLRRKFSNPSIKYFYDRCLEWGEFEDLIYYEGMIYSISAERGMKKTSDRSFKRFHKTLKDVSLNGVHMKMLPCPAGTFIMGHDDQDDNKPRPEVIERSFLLGETEVTQELYQAVMGTNPSSHKNDSQNPVEQVSWDMAILFCNALSKLQGLEECYSYNENSNKLYDWLCDFDKNGYRLPEEKEWEYAAKAGTQNKWAGTNDANNVELYAICDRNSKIGGKYQTHQVKSKLPNEWGFYDMSGNVSEWCWDKYNSKGDTTADRIYRGGNWMYNDPHLRSAHRSFNSPDYHNDNLGFRVCRTIIN